VTTKAREFIDFWIENSVHAREHYGMPGAEQRAAELARRLIEAARAEGISEKALTAELGDVTEHVRDKLAEVNQAEKGRREVSFEGTTRHSDSSELSTNSRTSPVGQQAKNSA
jgi:hypothetical protein